MLQRSASLGRPTAVELEVIRASLGGIVQEMQNSLFRTGFSTIIRESQDASCALLDANAAVIAQHVVLPLHIGAFPACTQAVLHAFAGDIAPGDAFLINDPYEGGSPHAPDMAVITPLFFEDTLVAFCASIAHKGDIGGPVPGSCSGQAREVFNEGLQLPPVRYQRNFLPFGDVERIIAANSRTPELVLGDIRGQLGSARLGERRLAALLEKFGLAKCVAAFDELGSIAERRMRAIIKTWKDGVFEAERYVDDDGVELSKPVRIHVRVEKTGDAIRFDFTGSADQTRGPANIRPPLVQAACAYALISLVDPNIFITSGILRTFTVETRSSSVLNPRYPAPVNTYNPTVHAVVDAIFAALGQLVPERSRADGCGSRSIILGGRGTNTGSSYVQYEIVGGGAGARSTRDGASGTTVNQSNAKIAPVEIIESEFPTRLLAFELIRDSGGAGKFRGGLGIRRKYLNLADARFSIRSTKHVIPAEGYADGLPGRTGDIRINPDEESWKRLPSRYADYPLKAGDVFELETPGGGGYGDPLTRDPASVLADVREGYVSVEAAGRDYGVVLVAGPKGPRLDGEATQRLRAARSKAGAA
ncbi:hydantoinase B/oxoprolinase family protein [Sinorhizobium psoraleae]|uniref:Hydantoinase B/oxoprolinase family protein n=1 Tax=Sinorhizobium psoraleae TaxID=520838 RepID=A0ABT4KJ92_9HYPH|nr:hydantoinase B/oxoprolinase family protein [Sinorhizobium psoraleae]MCZ4092035.1 hydantoinase B/oxoprolinase family protein [Sinorhizobium psoraleae]